ncbi:MAG: hypothetical protein HBSAPP03_24950 [Phycisphaerae bacterium]|nr:MAG: hypothetical protein HBSAPP03_24950 [Phycisphaerae bacterium]
MKDGEGNLGRVARGDLDAGVWTLSRRSASEQGDTAPDSIHARVDFVTERAGVYLPEDWRVLVNRLRSPATTERIVREVFHGGAPDSGPALGAVAGVVSLSRTLERVALLLAEVVTRVWNARTWPDLDAAARVLAAIIQQVGPEAAFRIFTLGKGPVASPVGDVLGLGEDVNIVGEDVIREYASMGGDSKLKDARERFGKGLKSNVRSNIRNTLEYMDNTGSMDPLDDEDNPQKAVSDVLRDMDMEDSISVERLDRGTELVCTAEATVGAWFVLRESGVGTHAQAKAYKVRGRVVALLGRASRGKKDRVLYIAKNQISSLELLPPEPPPMPTPPGPDAPAKKPLKLKTREPNAPLKPTKSTGDEAGTAKDVVGQKKIPGMMKPESGKVKIEGKKPKG